MQVCSTPRRHTTKAMSTIFERAGVPISLRAAEFKVDADGMLPVGERLRAAHFVPGQFVDVRAKTCGFCPLDCADPSDAAKASRAA